MYNSLKNDEILLGNIVNIRTGKLDANAAAENGIYPFFTCSKDVSRINSYSYDCECVLIAGNGEINAKYYNGKFDAYQRTYIITSKTKDLNVKYLYRFLLQYLEVLQKQSVGGIIKYIRLNNLTDVKIKIPTLDVQNDFISMLELLDKSKYMHYFDNERRCMYA